MIVLLLRMQFVCNRSYTKKRAVLTTLKERFQFWLAQYEYVGIVNNADANCSSVLFLKLFPIVSQTWEIEGGSKIWRRNFRENIL
jgi:hypothetical protein